MAVVDVGDLQRKAIMAKVAELTGHPSGDRSKTLERIQMLSVVMGWPLEVTWRWVDRQAVAEIQYRHEVG